MIAAQRGTLYTLRSLPSSGPLFSLVGVNFAMNYYYATDDNEVRGPYSLQDLRHLLDDGQLQSTTLICLEGQDTWQPLQDLLPANAPAVAHAKTISVQNPVPIRGVSTPSTPPVVQLGSASSTHVSITNVNSSNVKQGAVIGGWLCFLLGATVMYFSLWAFFIYVPLFLVGFILSIVAMAQKRILGGIALLLITLIAPPAQWFCTFMIRGDKFLKTHLPPDKLLEYDLKKTESDRMARQLIDSQGGQRVERALPDQTATPATPSTELAAPRTATSERPSGTPAALVPTDREKVNNAKIDRAAADEGMAGQTPHIVELNSDTAPITYEFKAAVPTSRDTIAKYVLGSSYRNMDEFARHDFIAKLDGMIKDRAASANAESLYKVSVGVELGEYDFDKQVFPIVEKFRPALRITSSNHGESLSDTSYEVCFDNVERVDAMPVELEQAKTFAPALHSSRRAVLSFIGTLQRCVEISGNSEQGKASTKRIFLKAYEMTVSLDEGSLSASYRLPEHAAPAADPGIATNTVPVPEIETHVVRRLGANEIGDWDLDRIKDAINEIYGRYGVEFPKADVQAWAERQAWYHRVPGRTTDFAEQMFNDDEKFNLDLLVARRTALRANLAPPPTVRIAAAVPAQSPSMTAPSATPPPTPAPITKPGIDQFPELSPERVVTDVWNTNPQATVANFRSRYAGQVIRYTGTVARKNPKENLLVFKGGGFMASAYDIQVSLNEEKTPGFGDVSVGDRLIIVATLDRIVTPALGVGSNSIRLSDGWIYKKIR